MRVLGANLMVPRYHEQLHRSLVSPQRMLFRRDVAEEPQTSAEIQFPSEIIAEHVACRQLPGADCVDQSRKNSLNRCGAKAV
jgi:hypothetical protein